MKVTVKTHYGYLSAQEPTATGLARWKYSATAGEPETFDIEGLELPPPNPEPGPEPPEPIPQPPIGQDAVDMASVVITRESPDVRSWPLTASLTHLSLSETANADINFTKRNGSGSWPFVYKPGAYDTGIQYTLWVGCSIGGKWHVAGSIQCISRAVDDNYCPTGPTLQPGQLPSNWYYFAGDPLATYQPYPGEQVIWFVTAGSQRREDNHAVAERSNIVKVPFSPGKFSW